MTTTMLHELSVPDHTGDTKYMWDPNNPTEVDVARKAFNAAREAKMSAFAVGPDGEQTGERLDRFDPELGKIVMVRQMAGG